MWFKKNKQHTVITSWTYGFGIDNIPENKYLLAYASVNPKNAVITSDTVLPRIGDKIIIDDDTHTDVSYHAVVTDVCFNYKLKWIAISCDCIEIKVK